MVRPPTPRELALPPGRRVRRLAALTDEAEVAGWCAEMLERSVAYDDRRRPAITWLGGGHALRLLPRGRFEVHGQDYWPRVWGARGLLYVWRPSAESAVLAGLHDPAWRVREMCAKVARQRSLESAEHVLARLLDDPVARVRAAVETALTTLGDAPR